MHPGAQVRLRSFNLKLIVIVHEDLAVDPPPESRYQFSEQLQEVLTVPIVVND